MMSLLKVEFPTNFVTFFVNNSNHIQGVGASKRIDEDPKSGYLKFVLKIRLKILRQSQQVRIHSMLLYTYGWFDMTQPYITS